MEEQKKLSIAHYLDSYNQFDVPGMLRDLHPDIVFENIADGKVGMRTEGIEAFKKQAESATQFFTERQQDITSWSFEDQLVRIDIDYRAVLATDLPNGMKAGEVLALRGKSEFVFDGDKIIKIRDII